MYHIMTSPFWAKKAKYFMGAVIRGATSKKIEFTQGLQYQDSRYLLLYGLGGKDRQEMVAKHKGRVIAFDLGYWERISSWTARKYRVSIDGYHPHNIMQLDYPGSSRWEQSRLPIAKDRFKGNFNPKRIMIVGNAPKSISIGAEGWTASRSKAIKKCFPNSKIIYRPKPKRPREEGVIYDESSTQGIRQDLQSIDLVVCRHSNVAVDACIAGIPVVCDDGAASCIYPSDLLDYQNQPNRKQREKFLHHLAYWQWGANEIELFWDWLLKTLPIYSNK